MYRSILDRFKRDSDYPERAWKMDIYHRILDGTFYDVLPRGFHEEKTDDNVYIKLSERRPSVRSGILRTVVDDSVSLLFSEAHFPSPTVNGSLLRKKKKGDPESETPEDITLESLDLLLRDSNINKAMVEAATWGATGSVVLWLRILGTAPKFRAYVVPLKTTYLTPYYFDDEPDTLERVVERRKVSGASLKKAGYKVDDKEMYWFRREWNTTSEIWFKPIKISDIKGKTAEEDLLVVDEQTDHDLGFVPMLWVKNLPGGDEIDGAPSFTQDAIHTVIEIDYLLSQGGRGLKFSADPTLLIMSNAFGQQHIIKGSDNAILIDAEGDAKLLEINGEAARAVIAHAAALRDMVLENLHGNRANPDKLTSAQSGRALEMMHQGLIWIADRLRISYGEGALKDLLRMIVRASQKFPLYTKTGTRLVFHEGLEIGLRWPAWFQYSPGDLEMIARALDVQVKAGIMSAETAVRWIQSIYDVDDIPAELAKILEDLEAALAREIKIKSAGKPMPNGDKPNDTSGQMPEAA